MADDRDSWTTTEVVAYTRHDGPEPAAGPPNRWAVGALAATLGLTFVGVVSSDSLCPDHRAWVQALGTAALIAAVTALVALWRGWAVGYPLTIVAGALGVSIGLLDAVHAPSRGWLITLGFATVTVLAGLLTGRAWVLSHRTSRPAARTRPVHSTLEMADGESVASSATEPEARTSIRP